MPKPSFIRGLNQPERVSIQTQKSTRLKDARPFHDGEAQADMVKNHEPLLVYRSLKDYEQLQIMLKRPQCPEIDLHHLTLAQAKSTLIDQCTHYWQMGQQCVLIIHGCSQERVGEYPVLKNLVYHWLLAQRSVAAFTTQCDAHSHHGSTFVLFSEE